MQPSKLAAVIAISAAGILASVARGWPQAPAAPTTPAAARAPMTVRRVVLLEPDTGKAPSFPDTTWNEVSQVAPGHRAGVRLEVNGADSAAVAKWLDTVAVRIRRSGRGEPSQGVLLAPTFFRNPTCAVSDCKHGGVFAVFGYVGIVSDADTTQLRIAVPADTGVSTVDSVLVWAHPPGRFVLGASYGITLPLNSVSGRSVAPRLGMNGRLLAFELRPWQKRLWGLFRGPFLLEGEFLLGVAALQQDSASRDSSQTFRESSEGAVRLEAPLFDFGGKVSLRLFAQGGFVTVHSQPNYWTQQYGGVRLGMDAEDISGRQSFVEWGFGYSENLRPKNGRWRITVQLVIPRTPLVFQFGVNFSKGDHANPVGSDSPVVLSAFTTQDFQFLYNLIAGKTQPPSP